MPLDFPASPTTGQVYNGQWAWDGEKWASNAANAGVTQVNTTAPLSGGPITTSGTLSLTTPLAVSYGGTGATTAAAAPWVEVAGDMMTGALTVGANIAITGANSFSIQGSKILEADAPGVGHTRLYDTSGSVAIYLQGPSATNNYNNTTHVFSSRPGSAQFAVFDATNTRNVSGAWATFSDVSLKENIRPFTRGLEACLALNPVSFDYREDVPLPPGRKLGLIAQEVTPYIPEIVGETDFEVDGEHQPVMTLEPGLLVYALINAVKELSARLDILEQRMEPR